MKNPAKAIWNKLMLLKNEDLGLDGSKEKVGGEEKIVHEHGGNENRDSRVEDERREQEVEERHRDRVQDQDQQECEEVLGVAGQADHPAEREKVDRISIDFVEAWQEIAH